MSHPSEEDLILRFYGEDLEDPATLDEHLEGCDECRTAFAALSEVLHGARRYPVPERGPDYGERVWRELSQKLPMKREPGRTRARPWWLAAAAAVLLTVAFVAGRFSERLWVRGGDGDVAVRERILLVALDDHLARSHVLLLEASNAPERAFSQKQAAVDLVDESRLYRQTAYRLGDVPTAEVLEELERFLLDVAHGPDSPEARAGLRVRLEEEDVLFKLNLLRASVRHRELETTATEF